MPLSVRGLHELDSATSVWGIEFRHVSRQAVVDSLRDGRSSRLWQDEESRENIGAAMLHSPALLVVENGVALSHPILGYRSTSAYEALVSELLEGSGSSTTVRRFPTDSTSPLRMAVVGEHRFSSPIGAFFRHVHGTSMIAYDQGGSARLLDLTTGRSRRAPGKLDLVPSPDGRLFVTPGERGLEFYDAREILLSPADGSVPEPVLVDSSMTDQYPSIGITTAGDAPSSTTIRVITGWTEGVAVRDYDVRWDRSGAVSDVRPLGLRETLCPTATLSLPILSPDGTLLAARNERSGSTIVVATDGASCRIVADLGFETSKVAFSRSGERIAFSRFDVSSAAGGVSRTFIYDLDSQSLAPVPSAESVGLVIPAINHGDSLFILSMPDYNLRLPTIKTLCCVGDRE